MGMRDYAVKNGVADGIDTITDTIKWGMERQDKQNLRDEIRRQFDVQNQRAEESHTASMKQIGLQTESAQRTLDQQKEQDDIRLAQAHTADLVDAWSKSNNDLAPVDDAEAVNRNDIYNQMVDKKMADPEYQRLLKKPWMQQYLSTLDDRVNAFNEAAGTVADATNNIDELTKAGHVQFTGDGKDGQQIITGPTAENIARSSMKIRQLNGETIPQNIDFAKTRVVSPQGTDKMALMLSYIGKDGKEISAPATVNRSADDNDVVKMFSVPEFMQQSRQAIDMALAHKGIQLRAMAGDKEAQKQSDEGSRGKAAAVALRGQFSGMAPTQQLQAKIAAGFLETGDAKNIKEAMELATLVKPVKQGIALAEGAKYIDPTTGSVLTENPKTEKDFAKTVTIGVGNGQEQTFQWNNDTRKFDIPMGKPTAKHAPKNNESNQIGRDVAIRLREAQRSYQSAVKTGDPDAINAVVDQIESLNEDAKAYGIVPMPLPRRLFTTIENDQIREQAIKNIESKRQGIPKFFGTKPNIVAINQEVNRLKQNMIPGKVSFSTQQQGAGAVADMPQAGQHAGRIIRDTTSGKRYRSNGSSWVEVP